MTGLSGISTAVHWLMMLPTAVLADGSWFPDRTYCLIPQGELTPTTALCHDSYAYMDRLKRNGGALITFESGSLSSGDPRRGLAIETCITRADLSLICMFTAVGADD